VGGKRKQEEVGVIELFYGEAVEKALIAQEFSFRLSGGVR
jgi:hypothetical protein